VLQSQTFDNASWAKVGVGTGVAPVVTANAGAAPDGTTTADRIVFNTGAGTTSSDRSIFRQSIVLTEGSNGSFYIKSNTGSSQSIGFHNGGQIDIVTATTSWQRFNVNITSAVTFFGLENRGDNATAGTCDVLVWGAQLQNGDIATDYIATTTAAVSVGPVANVPRLDYLNSSCPRLLLEPQRTNLVTFSEQLNNAAWTKSNASVTANQTTSPSGYDDADLIDALTGSGQHFISAASILYTNAVPYTFSVFSKKGNTSLIQLFGASGVFGSNVWATYNFDTLEVTAGSASTASMVDYGSGWYRLILTGTITSVATVASFYAAFTNDKSVRLPSFTAANQTFYLWGAQTEQASYATSYIPTLGASVTRGADAASKTGISSLIGQTEGTIYFEVDVLNGAGIQVGNSTSAGDYVNSIQIAISPSATNSGAHAGGVSQFNSASAGRTGMQKIAVAYGLNNYALYINGTQIATDSSATVPAMSAIIFNHVDLGTTNGKVAQTLLFKTRLTNAQLAELTTI
jgi:hypothetical protein